MSTNPDPRDRDRNEGTGRPGRAPDRKGNDGPRNRRGDGSGYRSGQTLFIWITGAASLMVVLAFALAWVDSKMLNDINDFKAAGLTDLPADNASPGELVAFADDQGLECFSPQDLASGAGGCDRVLDISRRVNDYETNQSLVWSLIVIVGITLLVSFIMFIHQASSNLRHLRTEGQRFTPGWAVGWFFIPVMNLVQPSRVVRELVQASGSTDTSNPRAWQNASPPGVLLVSTWWTMVVTAFLFGPRGISFFVSREDIDAWAAAGRLLVWSDLYQVIPLVLTVIVVYRIQRAQENRHLLLLTRQTRSARNS